MALLLVAVWSLADARSSQGQALPGRPARDGTLWSISAKRGTQRQQWQLSGFLDPHIDPNAAKQDLPFSPANHALPGRLLPSGHIDVVRKAELADHSPVKGCMQSPARTGHADLGIRRRPR